MHVQKWFVSAGHNQVHSVTRSLASCESIAWHGGLLATRTGADGMSRSTGIYDYRKAILQFATTQVTYNTDCCGFSLQYRRFNFGTRNDTQYRVAFTIANIGTFGTLKKQERLF